MVRTLLFKKKNHGQNLIGSDIASMLLQGPLLAVAIG
jgi:hypothetical protein